MKDHVVTLAEAVRSARRELESRNASTPASADTTIRRLSALLEGEDVDDALAALDAVNDAPPITSEPPADFRVPYPWRARSKVGMR